MVAAFEGGIAPFWSADGSDILVRVQTASEQPVVIRRVSLAGVMAKRVDTLHRAGRVLHADGEVLVYRETFVPGARGDLVVITAAGDTSRRAIPGTALLGDWSSSEMRVPMVANSSRVTSMLLDVATGATRPLPTGASEARAPRWSPNGRQLAVQTRADSVFAITVMNPDGSQARRYDVRPEPINVAFAWSPDGNKIAFRSMQELLILDVASGDVQKLGPSLHPHHLAWNDDSRSLTVARILDLRVPPPRHLQLFDSPLAGSERLLRDINAEFSADPMGFFVTSREFVLVNPQRIVIDPLGGERMMPGAGPRTNTAPASTNDGRWLLLGVGSGNQLVRQLELIDVQHAVSRLIDPPFDARTAGFNRPALLADHQAAIVLGRENASAPWQFFHVPLNGGAPRAIATIGGDPTNFHFDLSPDARTLAYAFSNAGDATVVDIRIKLR